MELATLLTLKFLVLMNIKNKQKFLNFHYNISINLSTFKNKVSLHTYLFG